MVPFFVSTVLLVVITPQTRIKHATSALQVGSLLEVLRAKPVWPANIKKKQENHFVCPAAQEPIKTTPVNPSAPIVLLDDRMQTVKVRLTVPNVTLENIPTKRANLLVNHVRKVLGTTKKNQN